MIDKKAVMMKEIFILIYEAYLTSIAVSYEPRVEMRLTGKRKRYEWVVRVNERVALKGGGNNE